METLSWVLGSLLLVTFFVWLIHWLYVHLDFYRVFKHYEPELFKHNCEWSFLKYSTGSALFDFALSGKFKISENDLVITAGERLVKAYDVKFKIIGFTIVFFLLWFVVKMATIGIE